MTKKQKLERKLGNQLRALHSGNRIQQGKFSPIAAIMNKRFMDERKANIEKAAVNQLLREQPTVATVAGHKPQNPLLALAMVASSL